MKRHELTAWIVALRTWPKSRFLRAAYYLRRLAGVLRRA